MLFLYIYIYKQKIMDYNLYYLLKYKKWDL